MGLTHFPNGVTTQAQSAENASAGAGDINCQDCFVDGTATISVTSGTSAVYTGSVTAADGSFLGESVFVSALVGSLGTVSNTIVAAPFAGKFGTIVSNTSTADLITTVTVYASSVTSGAADGTLTHTSVATVNIADSTAVNGGTFAIGSTLIMSSAAAGSDGTAKIGVTLVRTA